MRILATVSLFLCIIVYCTSEYRDVTTDQGVVRGYNADDDGVFSFYGIPYATAPTGNDVFKAPLPPPKWNDIFNSTIRNVICPQRPIFSDTFLQLNRTIDCLRINVFMPNTTETKLPVMLYIHGGAFQEGYGMIFQPLGLAKKGIIAVNINYRLGVHGFLCLGTEFAPGNAGLKDQVAALKWLKRNIINFGGDPDNISLAGSSAGSISVDLLMLSPMANGLFNKVVKESGSAILHDAVTLEPLTIAKSFADQFLDTVQNTSELETFYKEFSQEVLTAGFIPKSGEMGFIACIENHVETGDEKFLEDHPKEIFDKGSYENHNILAGFTIMEGLEFIGNFNSTKPVMESNFVEILPSFLEFDSYEAKQAVSQRIKEFYFPTGQITYQGFVNYYTDTVFIFPQLFSARQFAKRMPVYLFLYSFNGTVNLPSIWYSAPIWGPGHVAESLYIQDYDYKPIYDNMTEHDHLMRDRLRELWVNFFKYGEPTPTRNDLLNVDWKPMDQHHDYFLNMDAQLQLSESPMKERMALWDSIYKSTSSESSSKHLLSVSLIILSLFTMLV